MSTHKCMDKLCVVALVLAMLVTVIFMHGDSLGVEAMATVGYEQRLFDTSRVHTIDIVMDDWEDFLSTCENEEYETAAVVIDGEACRNIGIRAKGNTSLSQVSQMGSSRYSLKIEFDHYDASESYYGLDKLCLNNIIQDNTYMKDYLSYRLMAENGVNAPLCSYAYVTVNGEDWGLYLAVEDVEDGFLARTFGSDHGAVYKPDSQSFGGGRGNGKDFDMADFDMSEFEENRKEHRENGGDGDAPQMPGGAEMPEMPDGAQMPDMPDNAQMPDMSERPEMPDGAQMPDMQDMPQQPDGAGMPQGGGMSMGSADVKLQYIDDDIDSYANIFDHAKTDVSTADQKRLIASLKSLSENEDIASVVDTEQVLRYFVVHGFLCNDDSYTGAMIHNYYLYEEDGQLSMIPWDYNLAFGGFQASDATETVNSPIDTPVSGGSVEDRPMLAWIFADEEYTRLYHEYYAQFLEQTDISALIAETKELIAPYVESDPTAFCTYEEFETGVETLTQFCELRVQSILGQLDGTIPSTTDGQREDSSALIDASSITLSDMGSMQQTMGGGRNDAPPMGAEKKQPE